MESMEGCLAQIFKSITKIYIMKTIEKDQQSTTQGMPSKKDEGSFNGQQASASFASSNGFSADRVRSSEVAINEENAQAKKPEANATNNISGKTVTDTPENREKANQPVVSTSNSGTTSTEEDDDFETNNEGDEENEEDIQEDGNETEEEVNEPTGIDTENGHFPSGGPDKR